VRHGSLVERERFATLPEALAELERRAEQIRDQGGLPQISGFRDYEPGDRVAARLELSGRGILSRADAGLDVMGDGALVCFRGAVVRRRLEPDRGRTPYETIAEALQR
jgi:hypothetical protein